MKYNLDWVISAITFGVLIFMGAVFIKPTHAQTTPIFIPWFTITSGSTTCKAVQVIQTPIHINYSCSNAYGGNAGSYTANGTGGALGGEIFSFALNSMGPSNDSVYCIVSVNSTAAPLMMNGGTVQANSAAYSCSGTTGPLPNGTGSITWP